jgi:hypothetical protein
MKYLGLPDVDLGCWDVEPVRWSCFMLTKNHFATCYAQLDDRVPATSLSTCERYCKLDNMFMQTPPTFEAFVMAKPVGAAAFTQ